MNTAELIVELVLTGILMLAILFLPALAHVDPRSLPDGEVLITLAIAGGFLLGVVIDRCSDSILERWLSRSRCAFAWEDKTVLARDRLGSREKLRDPFPEDWLRNQVLSLAPEAVLRHADQLRIRMRIARTLTVLAPALATSSILVLWADRGSRVAVGLPAVHLGLLLVASAASGADAFKGPRTDKVTSKAQVRSREWFWKSPAVLWYALQVVFAAWVGIEAVGTARVRADAVFAVATTGAVLTVLAYRAWTRIGETFLQFVWSYSAFRDPAGLAGACFEPPRS